MKVTWRSTFLIAMLALAGAVLAILVSLADEEPAAGLRIYAAAPDSERLSAAWSHWASPTDWSPGRACQLAEWCSSDPAVRGAGCRSSRRSSLHGAACHAYLFLSETSREE